jgi:ASC-1-like (ASCH) protein
MKLTAVPFNKIASGKKIIESRLFDEKRQAISIGDPIIFSEIDNPNNTITTTVKGLLRHQTFKELFSECDPALFREDNHDFLLEQIKQFYSHEEEKRCGVVGIRIQLV